MKPEYFPPKEDLILQNEAPTDLYVLVTGAVVRTSLSLSFSLSLHLSTYLIYLCRKPSKIGRIIQIITLLFTAQEFISVFVLFFGLSGSYAEVYLTGAH